ncbi:24190_t:CDS:2 [Gigaspora margarita]|uniref:24190_t:CDS:1 n=1 Tax=Gigaspora margarita TaxID=4874 RepID=A0ABN7UL42_GIGMA|nr:24190_t:CDS:2 [Gigaspora margarita]
MSYLDIGRIRELEKLCQEIVTEYGTSYNAYKILRLVQLCQEIGTMYSETVDDQCDVSGSTQTQQPEFTDNQLNDFQQYATTSINALFDNMINSNHSTFEDNHIAPIMSEQNTDALRIIPYKTKASIEPTDKTIRKKSETKIKKPRKSPNAFMFYNKETRKKIVGKTFSETSKEISRMWRNESLEERSKYEKKAEEAKNEHTKNLKECNEEIVKK